MPKMKRLTTFLGNYLNPLYKNMQSAQFFISPYDRKGNGIANYLITNFKNGDPKLKQPNFKVKVENVDNSANTFVILEYKNGWKNKIVLTGWNGQQLLDEMKEYHQFVDLDLQLKGQYEYYPADYDRIVSKK